MALADLVAHYWQPIAHLLQLEGVNDIFIDRYDCVYYTRDGVKHSDPARWATESDFFAAANVLVTNINHLPLTAHHPKADARFEDGCRLAVHVPPLTQHTAATIRVMRPRKFTMDDLAGQMFALEMVPWLRKMFAENHSLLVTGATGSGKTTLLRAALLERCAIDRLFVIEDTAELCLPLCYGVAHEVAAGNAAGLTMADSIHSALRMAPDRIVVGELRTENAMLAFVEASETGFPVVSTLHADSAEGALTRMVSRLARLGIFNSMESYEYLVHRAVSGIVHCARCPDGRPRVVEVAELRSGRAHHLWAWDGLAGGWVEDDGCDA